MNSNGSHQHTFHEMLTSFSKCAGMKCHSSCPHIFSELKIISLFYFLCRLLKDYRREMESHALRWGKLLLPLMAHRAIKIHERALEVVKAEFSAVLIHQRELSQALIPEFKLVTYNCVAMSGLVKTRRNEIRALVHYMY